MLQVRENIFICDQKNFTSEELEEAKITRIFVVGERHMIAPDTEISTYYFPLKDDRKNPSHIKDLACHCPKYMTQNGDIVLIVDEEGGMGVAAYIAARVVCELEGKSIYDVFMEIKEKAPEFDIGKAYY